MKLNDVFKLNLQSKGGAKLFDRIMNRYGIPKDEGDVFKESVEVVSSAETKPKYEYEYVYVTEGASSDILQLASLVATMYYITEYKWFRDNVDREWVCVEYPMVGIRKGRTYKILKNIYPYSVSYDDTNNGSAYKVTEVFKELGITDIEDFSFKKVLKLLFEINLENGAQIYDELFYDLTEEEMNRLNETLRYKNELY